MAKKSLILYESMTGNTEKVGMRFKQSFEKKGWKCTMFKVDKLTDPANLPFKFDDFDFVCVGSPVIENRPSYNIIRVLANHPDSVIFAGSKSSERIRKLRKRSSSPNQSGQQGGPPGGDMPSGAGPTSYGISTIVGPGPHRSAVFVTYSGAPPEAELSLRILEDLLYLLQIKCQGQFACRGTEPRHHSVDNLASNWYQNSVEESADTIARFAANPNDPEFLSMSAADRELLKAAVEDKLPNPYRPSAPGSGPVMGTEPYYKEKRPSERDLNKAEIFIEEMIDETRNVSPFICIA